MECAPCRIDVREMGRGRAVTPQRSPTRSLSLMATAVLVLGIGLFALLVTRMLTIGWQARDSLGRMAQLGFLA